MIALEDLTDGRELVMVSNRLPVDRVVHADGSTTWRTSPGGLVTAVEPIVEKLGCLWVGWPGSTDEEIEPFAIGNMRLQPVELSEQEVAEYYEGFSNGTLWPLYHDLTARPEYHREWWDAYQEINARFARRVAESAAEGAIVWVHDYQLQLVPELLRELRPDLQIGYYLHIPFPPRRLFAQIPWRKQILNGLLGADVIGFQRVTDAVAFRLTAEEFLNIPALGNRVLLPETDNGPGRAVIAQEFPISIDAAAFQRLAEQEDVQQRALEIRADLGNPKAVLLGVDRLDYTKGIRHRLKAFDELLRDGETDEREAVMVQVASPSRERVDAYQQLRDDVEVTVGRINGMHGSIGHNPLVYLHQSFNRQEMAALYLAADVLVVTPLRDGMNLVAKEYVACRSDEGGALVLSEFAGAADELRDALLVNPHDIDGLKTALLRAIHMPRGEQLRRMASMRQAVFDNDVAHWAAGFLGALKSSHESHQRAAEARAEQLRLQAESAAMGGGSTHVVDPAARESVQQHVLALVPDRVEVRLRRLATTGTIIVATDFDGTVSHLVGRPEDARMLPRAQNALNVLSEAGGVHVALVSGRSLTSLEETGIDMSGFIVSGSHGVELIGLPGDASQSLSEEEAEKIASLTRRLERLFDREPGVRLEHKPFGIAVHTRKVEDPEHAEELLDAAEELGVAKRMYVRPGKSVREFTVRTANKGEAIQRIRDHFPGAPVLFMGDDVTDEDVFRVLGTDDCGIKVGDGETLAAERIADPPTAAAVLAMLAELRTGIVVGS